MGVIVSCFDCGGGVKDEEHPDICIPHRKRKDHHSSLCTLIKRMCTMFCKKTSLESGVILKSGQEVADNRSSSAANTGSHVADSQGSIELALPLEPSHVEVGNIMPAFPPQISESLSNGLQKVAIPQLVMDMGEEGSAAEETTEELIKASPGHEPRAPLRLIGDAEKFAAPGRALWSPRSEILLPNEGQQKSCGAGDVKAEPPFTITISCLEDGEDAGETRSIASPGSSISSGSLSDGWSDDDEEEATPIYRGTPITSLLAPKGQGPTSWPWSDLTPIYKEGEGGQAEAWSCCKGDSESFCAKIGKDERGRAAIVREAELALDLDHPNVLSCFALVTDEHGDVVGMATELLGGDDLLAALASYNDPLSMRQMAQIAVGIAQAMAHLHGQNIVHRDIKPGNLLLEKRVRRGRDAPRVVLADLGIARRMEEGQDYAIVDDISGSLPYLDPAVVRGKGEKRVSAATDVFSFGMTLYHMAAQEEPFEGMDTATHITLMLEGKRQSCLARPEGCDDLWWHLIKGCTRPAPRMRFTVPQILKKLEAILATA